MPTLLASIFLSAALAQPSHESLTLRPVEPFHDDTSPLSTRQRVLPLDLRLPQGFERVYEISPWRGPLEARAAYARPSNLFARVDGGIVAVFPRSTYVPDSDGRPIATTPPGTIFSIGSPSRDFLNRFGGASPRGVEPGDAAATRDSTRGSEGPISSSAAPESAGVRSAGAEYANLSASQPADGRDDTRGQDAEPVARTAWTSESHRKERLRELLTRAANATAPEKANR